LTGFPGSVCVRADEHHIGLAAIVKFLGTKNIISARTSLEVYVQFHVFGIDLGQ
jgi:hypothetical protein